MYVILASRPGVYRTEPVDGLAVCESYDYQFGGRTTAHFAIATLTRPVKVRVIDETPPERINQIPSKFLPQFATLEAARAELRSLLRVAGVDTALQLRT
jgi:hypothetical protein